MATTLRKCFVSYHHERNQDHLTEMREKIGRMELIMDHSLKDDISHLYIETIYKKIREKMRGCSVVIILIGHETAYRKWVDWELWAALRPYRHPTDPQRSFKPKGLLAIFLPGGPHAVPSRLQDNIDSGYAVTMHWNYLSRNFKKKLEEAYENREYAKELIVNNREIRQRNSRRIK